MSEIFQLPCNISEFPSDPQQNLCTRVVYQKLTKITLAPAITFWCSLSLLDSRAAVTARAATANFDDMWSDRIRLGRRPRFAYLDDNELDRLRLGARSRSEGREPAAFTDRGNILPSYAAVSASDRELRPTAFLSGGVIL